MNTQRFLKKDISYNMLYARNLTLFFQHIATIAFGPGLKKTMVFDTCISLKVHIFRIVFAFQFHFVNLFYKSFTWEEAHTNKISE